MNPLVWRFMGGVTVATAVDLVIPGYSRILFAGLGAALPEGSKKAGVRRGLQKGLEGIGKAEWKVLTSPKYLGRFGPRMLATRAGARVIPVIGWMILAYDGIQLGMYVRSRTHQMLIEKRGYGFVGGPESYDPSNPVTWM
jgi:hypothetical protein